DDLVGVLGKPGRCGPRVRVHATGRLRAVDVVDVEVEDLLLVDQEVLTRVRHGVGGRGPACGLVVLNGHVDGAGDLHGVSASRVTLVLSVNEVRRDSLLPEIKEHLGVPNFRDEVFNGHLLLLCVSTSAKDAVKASRRLGGNNFLWRHVPEVLPGELPDRRTLPTPGVQRDPSALRGQVRFTLEEFVDY